MESQDLGLQTEESRKTVLPKRKGMSSNLAAITGIFGVFLSAISLFVIFQLNQNVQSLKAANSSLSQKVTEAETKLAKIDTLDATVKGLKSITFLNAMQHEIEGGIVTDDFTVNKVQFYPNDATLKLQLDVDNQPSMDLKYKGKGSYDLADRELRAKAIAIIDQVKSYYQKNAPADMPKWDDKTEVYLTVKNYDIGKQIGSQFTLAGEK
jgi:hypothetical protein